MPTPPSPPAAALAAGGAASEELPSLVSEYWVLQADSPSQRNELLDYAKGRLYICTPEVDSQLSLGVYASKLLAYEHDFNPDGTSWNEEYRVIGPSQFRAMCDAYAASHA